MDKRILIVDDAPDIAAAFKKQLELAGSYAVETAGGGQEALEKIAANPYDLVLLDLIMPDIDGIEVLNELRGNAEKYKGVPVIVLTNVTSPETREEVEGLDVTGFVVKTDVDIDEVAADFFSR